MTDLAARPPIEEAVDEFLALDEDHQAALIARLGPDYRTALERAVRNRIDPDGRRVYRTLGYEPICIPRVQAALAAGHRSPIDADDAGTPIPAPCGECPSERLETATEFEVLYGGAVGSSKTRSTLMLTLRLMARHDGLRALLLRETYDELDENVYPELRAIEYAEAVGGHWNAGRRQLDIGQSSVRFRYMGDLEDVARRRGGSYQLLVLDEGNQLPRGTVDALRDRLRSANPDVPVIGIRITANPGGRSHGELKQNFVVPTDYGAHVADVRIAETGAHFQRRFIPAKATDNPYLGEDYYAQVLGAIADPVLRAAMRDGDWDVFVGAYFPEYRRERHVIPRGAVEIASSWKRYAGIDYGRAAPWCCLWAAVDGDGRAWAYREEYAAEVGEKDQARRIRSHERAAREQRVSRAGDPAMWARVTDANSIAQTYKDEGVVMVPANNDRLNGWARVHSFLADGPACLYHRSKGWDECPLVHFVDGATPDLVRELTEAVHDKRRPEDLDTTGSDHALDAFRYLLMQVTPPRRPRPRTGALLQGITAGTV